MDLFHFRLASRECEQQGREVELGVTVFNEGKKIMVNGNSREDVM